MSRIGSTNFKSFGNFGSSSTVGKDTGSSLSTNKKVSKIDPNDYAPKRFGLRFDPPTIIVEYLVPSSGKLYHHKLKIANLKADSDTYSTLEAIKKKHPQYFGGNKIADNQITDFIERLKKKLPGGYNGGIFLTNNGFGENKLDSDAKVGKLAPLASTTPKTNNNLSSFDMNKTKTASTEKAKNDNNFWAFDDLEDLEEEDVERVDYNATNLNKLSQEELQKHKDKMSVLFNKNQKKPGEAGFEYDKQEEFEPQGDNEWDEDF